jgi:hypothetical protein
MEAQGVISMELTVGSKSLATPFFIIEVQGNYSVILGHDWIHANYYIPSTLHQFLIQWIDDEVEVVHVDASSYIALSSGSYRLRLSYRLQGRICARVCKAGF